MPLAIKSDTLNFTMDKKAHFGVSFGLYYFFFTYTASMPLSLLLGILVGLSFEVYQGYSKHHGGYSHYDMFYNLVGSVFAFILHIQKLLY